MSRPAMILAAVIVLLVVLTIVFAARSGERPQTHVEKVVPIANLAQ